MLKEEQAAELLRRCEVLAGFTLPQVRGRLRNAASRAAAVWELLVVDAASRIGKVEYESPSGGPDIRLQMPSGRWVWIEVAYLYPRFWREEKRSRTLEKWVREQAKHMFGQHAKRISCSFHGDVDNPAGPVRRLPAEHERSKFLADQEVIDFFRCAQASPNSRFDTPLTRYTVTLTALPEGASAASLGGGLVQEVAKTVQQHAVFRILRQKRKQHNLEEPRLVCIGSDASPALSSLGGRTGPGIRHAVDAAFRASQGLSGALVVQIENNFEIFAGGLKTHAAATLWLNERSRNPLELDEQRFLQRLNFNHWRLSFSVLTPYEPEDNFHLRRVGGTLSLSIEASRMKITIPCPVLVDALVGRKTMAQSFGLDSNEMVIRYLQEGWTIAGCVFQEANLERGLAASIILELTAPHDPVFWPTGSNK